MRKAGWARRDSSLPISTGITLKPAHVMPRMRRGGAIVAETLSTVRDSVRPGVTTADLDRIAEETIRRHKGARPAFKGYRGFPATLCVSVNEEVVHGIPSGDRCLEAGDIVSLDVGVQLEGYYTDAAITVTVGETPGEVARFLVVTERALMEAIERARPGNRLGDISATIQGIAEGNGYSVVRSLVGHGIGASLHEDPQVPNFGEPGTGIALVEGLVMAIEPMFNMGGWEVRTLRDNWTVVTADGSRSAHFEHTIAVSADDPLVLTACGL